MDELYDFQQRLRQNVILDVVREQEPVQERVQDYDEFRGDHDLRAPEPECASWVRTWSEANRKYYYRQKRPGSQATWAQPDVAHGEIEGSEESDLEIDDTARKRIWSTGDQVVCFWNPDTCETRSTLPRLSKHARSCNQDAEW